MTGYEIILDVIAHSVCDELIDAAYRMDKSEPRCVSMPHRKSDKFLEAMRNPFIVGIAKSKLGECDGLGSDYFFHPPGSPGMAEHTDNDYVEADADSLVSVWIALTDVKRENGCLYARDQDIVLSKGDAVLIAQDLPHGSRHNHSTVCRHALLLTYLKHGSGFRPGNTQKRSRVPL